MAEILFHLNLTIVVDLCQIISMILVTVHRNRWRWHQYRQEDWWWLYNHITNIFI